MTKIQQQGSARHVSPSSPDKSASLSACGRVWAKIGILSFGGPAAQIALMHREIVAERGWLTDRQFSDALSFCMLLPGPEAMQLATYFGWRLHGLRGGLLAGGLFILPGALVMLALAAGYVYFGTMGWIESLFVGLKAGISIIVLQALGKLAHRTLHNTADWLIAIAGFIGIFFANLPFPLIIASAAFYGFVTSKPVNDQGSIIALPNGRQNFFTLLNWAALWWLPILAVDYIFGAAQLAAIGYFFSQLAVVTFGGAYAVLAYMAQDVVVQLGWLQAGTMTAFNVGGLAYGIAGAAIALWATFIPCFLWIFVGAPYIEWLTHQPRLQAALSSIMAAVVGVIANLFLWFVLHIVFMRISHKTVGPFTLLIPDITSADMTTSTIAVACGVVAFWREAGLFMVLMVGAGFGILSGMITL
jgi:chromate transporter